MASIDIKKPAGNWSEAFPIGNGKLGAMVFGGISKETLSLNEDTLWTGKPDPDRIKEIRGAREALKKVRELLFDHRFGEAERMILTDVYGTNRDAIVPQYQPMAELYIHYERPDYTEYMRSLSLDEAVASCAFNSDGVAYVRDVFSSYPDAALVLHELADKPGAISCIIDFECPHVHTVRTEEDCIILSGRCPEKVSPFYEPAFFDMVQYGREGIPFELRLRAQTPDGETDYTCGKVIIKHASELTLVLTAVSGFAGYDKPYRTDYSRECAARLDAACQKGYKELLAWHTGDYSELFGRMSVSFGDVPALSTDERLARFAKGEDDPALFALKYDLGRYLMISASRPGSEPINLQGIWNKDMRPMWMCNHTMDINTEMQYWSAPVCDLAECQEPLNRMIRELSVEGEKVARIAYGLRGWCSHGGTSIWRGVHLSGSKLDTNLSGAAVNGEPVLSAVHTGMWPVVGGWLTRHLFEQYRYTQDKDFLKEQYPILRDAALFLLDWLVDYNGELLTCPAASPENEFIWEKGVYSTSIGSAVDQGIIRDTFNNCIAAAETLQTDEELCAALCAALEKMQPFQVGKYGQLMEWGEDYEEANVAHRHISLLYGLYPANVIPKALYGACRTTLERRGDAASAWEASLKAVMYARLGESQRAYAMLKKQLMLLPDPEQPTRGCFVNLLDSYPPFQIDGNLGFTAVLSELLLQSHDDVIQVLPALPEELPNGSIKGIMARGGFKFDIYWKEGRATKIDVYSKQGGRFTLVYDSLSYEIKLKPGEKKTLNF